MPDYGLSLFLMFQLIPILSSNCYKLQENIEKRSNDTKWVKVDLIKNSEIQIGKVVFNKSLLKFMMSILTTAKQDLRLMHKCKNFYLLIWFWTWDTNMSYNSQENNGAFHKSFFNEKAFIKLQLCSSLLEKSLWMGTNNSVF